MFSSSGAFKTISIRLVVQTATPVPEKVSILRPDRPRTSLRRCKHGPVFLITPPQTFPRLVFERAIEIAVQRFNEMLQILGRRCHIGNWLADFEEQVRKIFSASRKLRQERKIECGLFRNFEAGVEHAAPAPLESGCWHAERSSQLTAALLRLRTCLNSAMNASSSTSARTSASLSPAALSSPKSADFASFRGVGT